MACRIKGLVLMEKKNKVAEVVAAYNNMQYQNLVNAFGYQTVSVELELVVAYNNCFTYQGPEDPRRHQAIRQFYQHLLKFLYRMLTKEEFKQFTKQVELDQAKLVELFSNVDLNGLDEAILETTREINLRRSFYAKQVNAGKMKKEDARRHYDRMKMARSILVGVKKVVGKDSNLQ